MNIKIQGHHLEADDTLRRVIDRQSRKITRLLPTFSSEDLELHITLEKLPRGQQYHTVLVLTTPQRVIRIEEMENNLSTSLLRSFEELTRRVKKFKSQLNRKKYWKREYVSGQVEIPAPESPELEDSISQNLERVENYIRREVYHRSVSEGFSPGLLDPQAVLDEVFLSLSTQADTRPAEGTAEQWMVQVSRAVLNRMVQDLQESREQPHLEDAGPPPKWDDEASQFHHPEEVIHLEDLLRDEHSLSPEELLSREETMERLQEAIAGLPAALRESFVLFDLEGFHSDEVAMITGKEQSEVINDVETARSELKRRMLAGQAGI